MANTYGYSNSFTKEAAVWKLFGKVAIGASGAPTLNAPQSKGIASISRSSAGVYVITLSEVWNRLLGVDLTYVVASGLAAAPNFAIKAQTIDSAGKTITVEFSTGGAATDPDNGATLLLEVTLKNSSV